MTLDDDVFQAAQVQAQASGKTPGQVLSQLARRGLRADPSSATKSGLQIFKVQPDAEIIPSRRANQLLGEDLT